MATEPKAPKAPKGKTPAGSKAVVPPVVDKPIDLLQESPRPPAIDLPMAKAEDKPAGTPVAEDATTTIPVDTPKQEEPKADSDLLGSQKSYTNTRIGKFVVGSEVWEAGESKLVPEQVANDKRFKHAVSLKVLVED